MTLLITNKEDEYKELYKKNRVYVSKGVFSIVYKYGLYKKYRGVLTKTVLDQIRVICKTISTIDKNVKYWNSDDALFVYCKIYEFPKCLTKNKNVCEKPIYEVFKELEGKDYEKISTPTANKRFNTIKSFFNWLFDYGYIKKNHFRKLKSKKHNVKDCNERKAYTEKHMDKIFSDSLFYDREASKTFKYWVPILSASLSMRQGEASQLYRSDIKFKNGIWFIRVDDREEGQRIKNKHSKRDIPITKKLIELGFIDFVLSIESGPIFRDIKPCERDGYGRDVSKWFSNKKKEWGFEEGYNFHSFRHYLINSLKQRGIDICLTSEITGHTYENVAYERYGKQFELKQKKKVLDNSTCKSLMKLKRVYPKKRKSIFTILKEKISRF